MRIDRREFIELTAAGGAAAMLPGFAAAKGEKSMMVTEESVDPLLNQPYIEINEERSSPEPHRYVHGGFKGTENKFSFYFPAKERYQGRFYHNTYPLLTSSDVGPSPIDFKINEGNLPFVFESGGYYVQTNQGGSFAVRGDPDPSISSGYRLNAAAAKFSRVVAAQIYGKIRRPYGYIHGGSGGSFQVMGCAENTRGVWDGFLPYVLGSTYALSFMSNARAYAYHILSKRNKVPGILDAIYPGGSGDPYAGLNEEEHAALREATLMGAPLLGWWQYQTFGGGGGSPPASDPTYTEDFWTRPGYLGTDPKSSIREDRIQFETVIKGVTAGPPATVELENVPGRSLAGAQLIILSGASAGKSIALGRVYGKTLTLGGGGGGLGQPAAPRGPGPTAGLQPGDRVRIDNSASLAMLTYHRHQLPPPEYYAWNQFRRPDGKPIYPQRPLLPPTAVMSSIGSIPTGHVTGKVLVMEAMMDNNAWAWSADWYRWKVKQALGAKFDDNFVLWFVENAQHDVPGHFGTQGQEKPAWARTISAVGVLEQGLRDLTAWVEKGVKPPSTHYRMVDTQVTVPASARERGGIQPAVRLLANGTVRTNVATGAPVKFAGTIEVPPGAGKVVAVEWDYEGIGEAQAKETLRMPQAVARVSGEHSYSKPGTYFAVLRAYSQRQGDAQTPHARVQNLARVRVIVS